MSAKGSNGPGIRSLMPGRVFGVMARPVPLGSPDAMTRSDEPSRPSVTIERARATIEHDRVAVENRHAVRLDEPGHDDRHIAVSYMHHSPGLRFAHEAAAVGRTRDPRRPGQSRNNNADGTVRGDAHDLARARLTDQNRAVSLACEPHRLVQPVEQHHRLLARQVARALTGTIRDDCGRAVGRHSADIARKAVL